MITELSQINSLLHNFTIQFSFICFFRTAALSHMITELSQINSLLHNLTLFLIILIMNIFIQIFIILDNANVL